MAVRDWVKIGARVLGAAVGATGSAVLDVYEPEFIPYINPISGGMAGYSIGATVGDLAAGKPPTKTVTQSVISPFDTNAGIEKNPSNRVINYQVQESNPGWSDKVAPIADPLVAMGGNIANAAYKGGAFKSTPSIGAQTNDINNSFMNNNASIGASVNSNIDYSKFDALFNQDKGYNSSLSLDKGKKQSTVGNTPLNDISTVKDSLDSLNLYLKNINSGQTPFIGVGNPNGQGVLGNNQ